MDMVMKVLLLINKMNTKLSLYLNKRQSITTYGGMEVWFHPNLIFALDGGE
jgi:hypothetical protein